MKLLSFGEIIWDVYPDNKFIGGAPLNFAAHAKRAGADSYLLSAVGDDELGREAIKWVKHYGVNTDYVAVTDYPTGQCRVTLDEKGVPKYNIISDTAYDNIVPPENISSASFDVLAFGTLALRGEHNRQLIAKLVKDCKFKEIFVDLNIRPPFGLKESIMLALKSATILKVSDEELPFVTECVCGKFADIETSVNSLAEHFKNLKLAVITCGGEPAHAYDLLNGEHFTCESVKTKVVSTVGAGDSYGATFLTNYMAGKPIPECMKVAAKVSAFVVSRTGAIPEE